MAHLLFGILNKLTGSHGVINSFLLNCVVGLRGAKYSRGKMPEKSRQRLTVLYSTGFQRVEERLRDKKQDPLWKSIVKHDAGFYN
jgi:hypothetical protein